VDRVIGVDWGTSSFRAYLIGPGGTVEDEVGADLGIVRVERSRFENVLEEHVGPWLERRPDAPIVLSGMIGSRQGWVEAPYLECPAGLEDVARSLTRVETAGGRDAWVVPGVRWRDEDGVPDVMRGEETQIFGALEPAAPGRRLFILPGTHSKWAVIEKGRIERFATYMTGEVFAVLSRHSLLGALMDHTADDPDAFRLGVERARAPGGLLHHLFGARTLGLFGDVPPSGLRSYLSGVLIGHEAIAAAGEAAGFEGGACVIGSPRLSRLYAVALEALGLEATVAGGAVAAQGLWRVAAMRTTKAASA
jgi:2-dehydro-3-deoxygalactonokinase